MNKLVLLFFVVVVLVFGGSGCESKSLGDTWTRPADEMVMVYVPEGEFEMGNEGEPTEQPVHTVALDGFWIDRTEVTNAQYQRCVEGGECDAPKRYCAVWLGGEPPDAAKTDHPVVCVDWPRAVAYCAWAGGRLPTEAEWEYTARGPEGFKYPWGDDEPNDMLLNYDDNVGDTTEVGSYPGGVSWCGALDMAGNVSERVADWYGEYPAERQENPTGPASGVDRAMRGSAWRYTRYMAQGVLNRERGSQNSGDGPDPEPSTIGFRCARDAD